ncbi:MAG TPA: pseudouridine synthase [Bradyrhizobium sp.]|nr:pseudouridine synthase [Bradyrhizobium sp.]
MPRDYVKDNASSRGGRRDRPSGGKGRSGAPRGPEKKNAKRGFGKRDDGDQRFAGGGRDGRPPRRDRNDEARPARFKRDDGPRRDDPRGERSAGYRQDRAPRGGDRERNFRGDRGGERGGEGRASGRFAENKFGDKRSQAPRGERFRKDGDRPRRDFRDGPDRGDIKPWQKREGRTRDHDRDGDRPRFSRSRDERQREDRPKFDRPRFDKPRYDRPRDERGGEERPRFSRPREERPFRERPRFDGSREDRPRFDRSREDRPKFDRPRRDSDAAPGRNEGRREWQEHPRSDRRSAERFADRPRRDNEDDSRIFARRPAFGGRGAYRERSADADRRPPRPEPKPKKTGERIAKVVARAGLASRRDAEEWITQGRVTVNGRVINSPALDVTANDVVAIDGKQLPPRERTRLFLYHKPRGLMTTHADPEGRPTVFDNLPEGLPRLISIGRLDFNTEGLLLLTNDGGLARALELPETGWLRRYRVRAHGEITQAQLDELKSGIEVDGVKYGPIDATLERDQGANVWLVFAIREGKNREVRNVMAHLGLEVNRLIRVSYGPFQLGELAEGEVDEVRTRVLREQLGEKVAALAGADFNMPSQRESREKDDAPRGNKPFKPTGKSSLIADRKGRRVLVQRSGSEEARIRNEEEASGYGPPRRPKRGYHGKRDLKPRDE